MNNEPFHVMAHGWRYSSRQKELLSNLHLAQLPNDVTGESVFISVTPPTGTVGGFTQPPITLPPIPPFGGIDWRKQTNNISPYWTLRGTDFSLMSGTYGFVSGTIGNFSGPRFLTISNHVWSMTGGVFLMQGSVSSTVGPFQDMGAFRTQLYTTPVNGGLGAPYLQDSQVAYIMRGVGWNNQMYLSEGNVRGNTSIIAAGVPYGNALSQYTSPSPLLSDPEQTIVGNTIQVLLRLGPDAE